MLIRRTRSGHVHAIDQSHHAHLSGILAGAWAPRLHARLVGAITLHDDPWRGIDRAPLFNPDTGLPHDFIDFPRQRRIELYTDGIDALEAVDPYVAFLVSRHYTTFAGTRDLERLQALEDARRRRLSGVLDDALLAGADDDLRWMKFFDVLSLHLCLSGPDVAEEDLPPWLRDPTVWSEAPDGRDLDLRRTGDELRVGPWPFADDELVWELRYRPLDGRFDDEASFREAFADTPLAVRYLRLKPA